MHIFRNFKHSHFLDIYFNKILYFNYNGNSHNKLFDKSSSIVESGILSNNGEVIINY